ncbi:hypothetical protein PMG11_09626 [Penicillium brasilianum]|uniref:Uncharacterized protein n=1 Tax=Penicillium brasilianum TaxID=104259 RepID=A0A0F7TWN0_PENBI|nr:hypothetical protein PMG11_09626 [Penicillium brasilianum]
MAAAAAAAAAAGEIAGLTALIGNIYGAIRAHVTGKAALVALLKEYQLRLHEDEPSIKQGLNLRHCQPHAMDLYGKSIVLAEWLASKHIKLTNTQGGPANRPWWKFRFKFSDRKKRDFETFLGKVQHASERLIDCVQSAPLVLIHFLIWINDPEPYHFIGYRPC